MCNCRKDINPSFKKKNLLGEFIKILKEIWLGFKIAEANRDKSQWGKF